MYRGSRKHILDLIDSDKFIASMNSILHPFNASLTNKETLQPKGYIDDSEYGLQFYIGVNKLSDKFNQLESFNFLSWWNPHGGKDPTWDMLSMCEINGKQGILLVEAKAHISEFDFNGKPFNPNSSTGSLDNHKNIESRISQANTSLNQSNAGFGISIDTHYQLSNRVAFAWQLNQLSIPVALLYLGFTGDTYFNDYFLDEVHWKQEFNKYIENVVPKEFINSSNSDFLFIESSIPIENI